MKFPKSVLFWLLQICLLLSTGIVSAQSRYDGHSPQERFSLNVGGYKQINHETKLRLDSTSLGLGTVIRLEDQFNVKDKTSMVFQLNGFYRYGNAHRIEWLWHSFNREGVATILENEIQIGDIVYELGDEVYTQHESDVIRFGYAWSFINVEQYEFFIGTGLNIRKSKYAFQNIFRSSVTSQTKEYDAKGRMPLPTASFGGRYNFTNKTLLDWRYEIFAMKVGNYAGRMQESTFSVEHNTFENIGFGLGITNNSFFLDADDGDFRGEVYSTYFGISIYMKTFF